jgi:predicted cupin superfamily sugar epimerase
MDIADVIRLLKLEKHPCEGGWFRETYRSSEKISGSSLPKRYQADRSFATLIFYLISEQAFSTYHRVKSDEIFHYYLGDVAILSIISPEGKLSTIELGSNLEQGNVIQAVVPHGHWQAAFLKPGGRWALLGAGVAPGFDYADFEESSRETMLSQFPQHEPLILQLTHA